MPSLTPPPVGPHSDNRRRFTRILFDSRIDLNQGDKYWNAVLIDLSLKGLLIQQPQNWCPVSEEPMNATLNLSNQHKIEMQVQQRHLEAEHVGFECMRIDLDSISHLRRLVELNTGDPDLLERELSALG